MQALKRTEGRVGDLNLLTVGIRSPDRAANLAYAKILTEALRTLPKSRIGLVAYNILDLRKFFHDHRWLYASEADLEDGARSPAHGDHAAQEPDVRVARRRRTKAPTTRSCAASWSTTRWPSAFPTATS